ncbi:hypothetical protein EVG20_g2966 [Dentipellis fragilis]|uniref:Fungal-type protein kinase domain-containing protein n=1 Tax=Dentipellis fragilis TaxID=205917 RepID=A0A4Y9Z7S8_9AGAM|nr:hypothetical protein EVG20_g2966 [Dentipellis fragilis]
MCDSELHLLKGLRGALEAHRYLCEMGFLHGNINAGNVLLYNIDEEAKKGSQGFLLDVELALVKPPFLNQKETVNAPPIQRTPGVYTLPTTRTHNHFDADPILHSTSDMLGTVQFMAWEVLCAIASGEEIERRPHHDVESFVWVLAYSVMRLVATKMRKDTTVSSKALSNFQKYFKDCFSPGSARTISAARLSLFPLTWTCESLYEDATRQISQTLANLFEELSSTIYMSANPVPKHRIYMTHDKLLNLLDAAIEELETVQ